LSEISIFRGSFAKQIFVLFSLSKSGLRSLMITEIDFQYLCLGFLFDLPAL